MAGEGVVSQPLNSLLLPARCGGWWAKRLTTWPLGWLGPLYGVPDDPTTIVTQYDYSKSCIPTRAAPQHTSTHL